jgi:hypothetical protein
MASHEQRGNKEARKPKKAKTAAAAAPAPFGSAVAKASQSTPFGKSPKK